MNQYNDDTENCLKLLELINRDVLLLQGRCRNKKEHIACERIYDRVEKARLVFKNRRT